MDNHDFVDDDMLVIVRSLILLLLYCLTFCSRGCMLFLPSNVKICPSVCFILYHTIFALERLMRLRVC